MNTHVVVLAAVTVLLHVSAGRGFSVNFRNGEHQRDAGDGTGMKLVSEESDVSNQDPVTGDLVPVEEGVGNDLHDIRRREVRSEKRSRERRGESGDESGMDQKHDHNEKVLTKGISDFLKPQKEMIINFMRPILDRIKHRLKKPSLDSSSESAASPAPSTPAPSSTPADSEASTSSDSGASSTTDSGAPTAFNSSANIFPLFPYTFPKCGENERHRSMNTLSLLFPDLQSNESEHPFVFVPLTNTLMRVVEQQIIGESQSGGDPRRKLHN